MTCPSFSYYTPLTGLQALWSDRATGVGPAALQKLIEEAEKMKTDISDSKTQCDKLKKDADALDREFNSLLQSHANSAFKGIETLGSSIVTLHQSSDKSEEEKSKQIATCKGQSKVVAEKFNSLHTKSKGILQKAGDVSLTPVLHKCPG
jgi:chaperonin cofactor prefoldin